MNINNINIIYFRISQICLIDAISQTNPIVNIVDRNVVGMMKMSDAISRIHTIQLMSSTNAIHLIGALVVVNTTCLIDVIWMVQVLVFHCLNLF